MAIVIKPITLEVSKPNLFQAIAAKQDDSNSRFLKVTFVNEGEIIPVTPTSKVTINAKRNDGQANSFFGEVNDDGTATMPVHSWMLELPGLVSCDVSILDSDDSKLTSTTFNLLVEEAAFSDGDISNDPQTDVLNELLDRVEGLDGGTSPLFAPVVRNEASGKTVKLTDISPIEHTLGLKVGGITRKCENLIPFPYASDSAAINGIDWTVNADGSITANGTATDNSFYPVMYATEFPNGKYSFKSCVTASGGTYYSYVIYNDGLYAYDYGDGVSFDLTTSKIQYIGLGVEKGNTVSNLVFKPILAKGTEAFWDLRSSPVTEVERWGENLAKLSNTESWGVATAFESYGKVVLTTTTAYDSQYARVATATLKKDTPYIVSVVSPNNVKSVRVWKTGTYEDLSSTGSITHTFTLNEDTSVDIALYSIDSSPIGTITSGYVVLVQGTTDTHQTLTIPESIQALEGYGDGINETCYNYVDFEKKQFVKRVGKVDMGTLNWVYNGKANDGISHILYCEFTPMKKTSSLLCADFTERVGSTAWEGLNNGEIYSQYGYLILATKDYTDIATFKSAMSGVMLYYELAIPEITDISNLLTNAKTLTSIYPETNLYTDNENGYLDVTYNADTKKYIDNKFAELQALILNA